MRCPRLHLSLMALGCGGGVVPPNVAELDAGDAAADVSPALDVRAEAAAHCECENLGRCCEGRPAGDACQIDVASGNETLCRRDVLHGEYECLARGFAPHCSAEDDALCPTAATGCAQCFTAIRNCGPVIQCVADANCKAMWDAFVACDAESRPFLECFDLLEPSAAPGELILHGAACADSCWREAGVADVGAGDMSVGSDGTGVQDSGSARCSGYAGQAVPVVTTRGRVQAMALDDDYLYFATPELFKVSRLGGATQDLMSGGGQIVIDGTTAYCGTGSGPMSVPVTGGTPKTLLSNPPWNQGSCSMTDCPPKGEGPGDPFIAVDSQFVYFTRSVYGLGIGETDIHLRRVPKEGGPSDLLAIEPKQQIRGLAVWGSHLYYSRFHFNTTEFVGEMARVDKAGGMPVALAGPLRVGGGVVANASSACALGQGDVACYWSDGTVNRRFSTLGDTFGIAMDERNVFVTFRASSSTLDERILGQKGLACAPLDGSTAQLSPLAWIDDADVIAADAKSVFVSTYTLGDTSDGTSTIVRIDR